MFLRPVLGAYKHFSSSIKNTRSLRPSIRIGKESFELRLDVHHFNKDEIRVKAHPEYVVIEGKQEKDTQQGYVLRQFIRKFKLPEGCVPSKMKCTLDASGILTVESKRLFKDATSPVEVVMVPIEYGRIAEKQVEVIAGPPPEREINYNPCADYPKLQQIQIQQPKDPQK